MKYPDLNSVILAHHDESQERDQSARRRDTSCDVEMFSTDLEDRLSAFIREAEFVVGCMAWFTNPTVLDALANVRDGCQIVVQKMDFLRPDVDSSGSAATIRAAYGRLRCDHDRYTLPGHANRISYCSDPSVEPVRCAGIRGNGTVPRMHHKFMVACRSRVLARGDGYHPAMIPFAVWTGSFNATKNGERSLENAVIIRSEAIAQAYAREWSHVLAMSEPLDWTSEYVEPEWRFGS